MCYNYARPLVLIYSKLKFSCSFFFVSGIAGHPKFLRKCSPQLMEKFLELVSGVSHFAGIHYNRHREVRQFRQEVPVRKRG